MSGQWPDALKPRTIVLAVVGVLVFVAVERFAKVLYSHAVEPSFKFCAAKCNIGPSRDGHDESAKAGLSLGRLTNNEGSSWSSFFMALCELVFVVAILSIVTYAIVYLSRDTRSSTNKTNQDQTLPAT